MTKVTALSLARSILTVLGSYIIGHNLGGHTIDANTYGIVGGAILTLIGAVWGVMDKTTTIEGFQSAVRSVIQTIGGIGVAQGLLKADSLAAILSLIPVLAPAIQSYTSRLKVKQIDAGKLDTTDKGKVKPASPKVS